MSKKKFVLIKQGFAAPKYGPSLSIVIFSTSVRLSLGAKRSGEGCYERAGLGSRNRIDDE
jgi:hypothetical protein